MRLILKGDLPINLPLLLAAGGYYQSKNRRTGESYYIRRQSRSFFPHFKITVSNSSAGDVILKIELISQASDRANSAGWAQDVLAEERKRIKEQILKQQSNEDNF